MKMPSKRQYDLVLDDGPDSKIPLHNEDAFQHGINFHAKYIGTLDVPRPGSRVEIVAAMRRIRYEFKAKAVKKKKISITISVDGVKVVLQKKNKRVGKQQWTWDESRLIVLQHPIYRIFYVSHDSQDLKIFSYIARDSSTNVFRCNVFKAYKKSQAMNIVRTIGQAFEVCHRISLQTVAQNEEGNDAGSEKSSEDGNDQAALQGSSLLEKQPVASSPSDNGTSTSTQSPEDAVKKTQQLIESLCLQPVNVNHPPAVVLSSSPVLTPSSDTAAKDDGSVVTYHRVQLLRQQLELQTQQTQFIAAQVQHLKDQLAAETTARVEAQTRTHQLLVQNRELLAHISTLVNRLVHCEGSADDSLSFDQQRSPKEILTLFDGSLSDASFLFMSASSGFSKPNDSSLSHNTDCKPELKGSPDSGHKEMSSGSLALGSSDLIDGWFAATEKTKTGNLNERKILDTVPPGLATTNAVRPLTISSVSANGMSINNLFSEKKSLPESGLDRQNNGPIKIITPIPAQDASGNRLELNIAPKLDPPPKINRNSSRFCGPLILGGSDKQASASSASAGPGKDLKPDSEGGKRYSWETYMPSDKQNGTVKKDFNTEPKFFCDEVKKSPEKLLGSVLHANGNDKSGSSSSTETFHAPLSSHLHGLKGIKNRFAVQHQNSVESTAKLKLSFSDNE